jgi:hypothetical protein
MLSNKQCISVASVGFQLISLAASQSCESFEIENTEHGDAFRTTTYPISFQVSDQINCTGDALNRPEPESAFDLDCNSTQCANSVPSDYMIRVEAMIHRDSDEIVDRIGSAADHRSIMTLISQTGDGFPGVDFNLSKAFPLTGAGSCMNNGTAGHWGLTAITACFFGTVGPGCEEIDEGTKIRACAPKLFSQRTGAIDGVTGWVTTSGVEDTPVPASARSEADSLLDEDEDAQGSGGNEDDEASGADESDAAAVGVVSSALLVSLGALSAAWSLA